MALRRKPDGWLISLASLASPGSEFSDSPFKMKILEYANRVHVFAPAGQFLFAVHAERAHQLVNDDGYVIRKRAGRKVREIEAAEVAPRNHKPCSIPTLTQYMGQKYTQIERTKNAAGETDGRVCQFKFIHPGDRPLFRLSVTDCLV